MSYVRDPVAIFGTKVSWTDGHVSGFIPWSLWEYEESANKAFKRTVLFYQPFGFGSEAWRSLDEYPFLEATPADFYDAVNRRGRFSHLPASAESYLRPWSVIISEAIGMLGSAGLEVRVEETAPSLHLVPDWESVISYERHLELIEKDWAAARRRDIERRVMETCAACAANETLYGDGYHYLHRKDLAFTACLSESDHRFLKTDAVAAYTATAKSNYQLLRGTIDRYSRLNSSKRLIRSHGAFRKLVEMGVEAVPFILNDLRRGRVGGLWSAEVLAEVVGRRGGDTSWWIAWAKTQNYTLGDL